jgi:hypothetical protein
MPGYKVNYKDFNPANIVAGKTESFEATGEDGKPIKYFRIPILYNYEIKKSDGSVGYARSELYIEGPRERSKGPATKEFTQGGRTKTIHSIITRYDLNNDNHYSFISRDAAKPGTIHKLAMGCCQIVYDRGSEVGINDCPHPDMMMYKLHYPVKWKLEKGLPIPGENPAGLWKLFRYGKEPYVKETSFFLPIDGGKKVDWSMIANAEIDHLPVFKVDNITIAGGRPSIKLELASSVIYDIITSGSVNMQKDTIDSASKDPVLEARLRDQIRQLEEALAATKVASAAPAPAQPVPVAAPAPAIPIALPGLSTVSVPVPVPEPNAGLMAMLNVPLPVMAAPAPAPAPVLSLPGGAVFDLPPLP